MTWPLWLGAALLLGLVVRLALETRAYNRASQNRREAFEEHAARSALYPPPRSIQVAPHTALNQALPLSVGTGGSAHEREFDEHQDTLG